MGLFDWLKKPTNTKVKEVTRPIASNPKLEITPIPQRKGYSEVFFGETYLGLMRFFAGRGCSCRNQYIFTPQDSKFVFTQKRESDMVKTIEIVRHLEYPKKLRVGYREISTISSIKTNQKRLTKYVNDLYTDRILKSIKPTKKELAS